MTPPKKEFERTTKAAPGRPGLKMKELVEATGVSKGAILHYLHCGLLPGPVKTSPNMAYYDPRCATRIRLIRQLQFRHRLTLAEIVKVLGEDMDEEEAARRLSLNEAVFGPPVEEGELDTRAFREATGLSGARLGELLRLKLLLPARDGWFDREDIEIGRAYFRALENGMQPEDMAFYVELGEKIVDREMALRRRVTHHLSNSEDAALTSQLVQSARMTRSYIIDRLFKQRVAAMRDLKEGEKKQ
jgi:DNA-binding transcriptional MerR regulator